MHEHVPDGMSKKFDKKWPHKNRNSLAQNRCPLPTRIVDSNVRKLVAFFLFSGWTDDELVKPKQSLVFLAQTFLTPNLRSNHVGNKKKFPTSPSRLSSSKKGVIETERRRKDAAVVIIGSSFSVWRQMMLLMPEDRVSCSDCVMEAKVITRFSHFSARLCFSRLVRSGVGVISLGKES